MKKEFLVDAAYLNIPICAGKEEKKFQIFLTDKKQEKEPKKIFEVMIPVDESQEENYSCDFYAQVPIQKLQGKEIEIHADMPEAFLKELRLSEQKLPKEKNQEKPVIHFTANTGWTNDPNGLIYDNGVYHLYFQYNPFDIAWNNMSWGHAVSKDLLHWTQIDSVMFPDEDGGMYSGCAIKNERGLLNLPKDAILYYYTAAGGNDDWSKEKEFTQKIAYSMDGGKTLDKIKEPCVPVIYRDSRDPKVYWHEKSNAYIMVLWLKENEFGILRSTDLKQWEMTDQFALEDGWECPDLFELTADSGEKYWFFWAADGYYYQGEFDGYHFKTDGKKKWAYMTGIPYAAQTYSGVADRIISIPWLRVKNDGRNYTGAYGIPVELSCKKTEEGLILVQKPVRELMEQAKPVTDLQPNSQKILHYQQKGDKKALIIQAKIKTEKDTILRWKVNGSQVEYNPQEGSFIVDREAYHGKQNLTNLLFIIDDRILEVFFDDGVQMGTFELRNTEVSVEFSVDNIGEYTLYEVN